MVTICSDLLWIVLVYYPSTMIYDVPFAVNSDLVWTVHSHPSHWGLLFTGIRLTAWTVL